MSGVWSFCFELPLRQPLDARAVASLDRPMPHNQMIVDPTECASLRRLLTRVHTLPSMFYARSSPQLSPLLATLRQQASE